MVTVDRETHFLIKLTEDLYRKSTFVDVDIDEINMNKFIRIALKNNMLYYCAKKIVEKYSLDPDIREKFEKILSGADTLLSEIRKSIFQINEHIPDYIIFKTYRGENFPRIGNDIDVLVRNEKIDSIKKQFIMLGYRTEYDDPKERSVCLLKEGQKKIHLHGAITWCWTQYLDEDLIYQKPRNVIYNGQEILIPNVNADFLIHMAHINFEPLLIIFSELLYLFKFIPEIDFDIILEQTKKYNWQKTFLRTLNLINNFHDAFYGELCSDKVEFRRLKLNSLTFPYIFSRRHDILSCLEKRLIIYPLTKIPKVISLFLTKDAYKYIDSPEREFVNQKSSNSRLIK